MMLMTISTPMTTTIAMHDNGVCNKIDTWYAIKKTTTKSSSDNDKR